MKQEVIFLMICHESLATPIRIVNHHAPIHVLGHKFLPMPFSFCERDASGVELEIQTDSRLALTWIQHIQSAKAVITVAEIDPIHIRQQIEGSLVYREGAIIFVARKGSVFA